MQLLVFGRAGRWIRWTLRAFLYLIIGLPLTLIITGEILIQVNELLLGEQAQFRFDKETIRWDVPFTPQIPGPHAPVIKPVPPGNTPEYHQYLVELFSPIIIQKVGHHPKWDIPLFLDFDGNENPRDNVVNEPQFRPHHAGIHGELTAETDDSYYLLYCLYHVKDYDHPIRELLSDWTYHDNDDEGIMFRVDKKLMKVTEAEGWYHNLFFLANLTGKSLGSEPIQGRILSEDETHVVVFGQSMGHGVRCAQIFDLDNLFSNTKILRFQGYRPAVPIDVDRKVQTDGTYALQGFDEWYKQALGPFDSNGKGNSMFEKTIPLGQYPNGKPMVIGRYIAGVDYGKGGWVRPKPPWSWDDEFDNVPIFIWHFFPSYAFSSHFGLNLSHRYLYNSPVEKTFHMKPDELRKYLTLTTKRVFGNKWSTLQSDRAPTHKAYWVGINLVLKRYLNRLFNMLG